MMSRTHTQGEMHSVARYSTCLRYRYSLSRCWQNKAPRVAFVMLNPSKATELQNDPTVERCERRARRLGFGAFEVVNIFAWCDTDPKAMKASHDPVGPENDAAILQAADSADQVIAAWGTHGAHLKRGEQVRDLLLGSGHDLFHLGLSQHGFPRHPLYVSYGQLPQIWNIS